MMNNVLSKEFENLSDDEIVKLCTKLKERLLIEFKKQDKSGIYGFSQRYLAYNSNKIEGSTLTEEQTASLFETKTLYGDEVFRSKDVEEMNGHFAMFNEMLKTLEKPLTEDIIKAFHYELKIGVFEDRANGYNVGEYKSRPNRVRDIVTALPEEVPGKIQDLLSDYSKQPKSLETLARFHTQYEIIHPFQDGNGRTGRVLLFRECLRYNIIPFIIEDSSKPEYMRALRIAQSEGRFEALVQEFEWGQRNYYSQMQFFLREYNQNVQQADSFE